MNRSKDKAYLHLDSKTVYTAMFNIRTLNKLNQLPKLAASAAENNIDIICIQEHRYYHCKLKIKYHDTGYGWTFVSVFEWKNSINIIGVVGMLLSPCALKSLNSKEKIQLRMMCTSFNGNPGTKTISCYSPTNAIDETDIIIFYNEVSSLV